LLLGLFNKKSGSSHCTKGNIVVLASSGKLAKGEKPLTILCILDLGDRLSCLDWVLGSGLRLLDLGGRLGCLDWVLGSGLRLLDLGGRLGCLGLDWGLRLRLPDVDLDRLLDLDVVFPDCSDGLSCWVDLDIYSNINNLIFLVKSNKKHFILVL
jgi:hypothetical protein